MPKKLKHRVLARLVALTMLALAAAPISQADAQAATQAATQAMSQPSGSFDTAGSRTLRLLAGAQQEIRPG